MPNIALCANHEDCDKAGVCDRHPGTYIAISERQNWGYFRGTDECVEEEAE